MDKALFHYLDKLNENGIQWALSEVLVSKEKENGLLIDWNKKYRIEHLNISYKYCDSKRKDYKTKDDEVLIMNY